MSIWIRIIPDNRILRFGNSTNENAFGKTLRLHLHGSPMPRRGEFILAREKRWIVVGYKALMIGEKPRGPIDLYIQHISHKDVGKLDKYGIESETEPEPDPNETLEETIERLAQNAPPWKPGAWFNDTGDFTQALWDDKPYYAKWINHQITLLISQETEKVIGCQIWGARKMMAEGENDDYYNGETKRATLGAPEEGC